jgi:hypothetical protein
LWAVNRVWDCGFCKGHINRATLYGRFSFKASGFLLQICESIEGFITTKAVDLKNGNGVEGERLNLVCFRFVGLDQKVSLE